MGNSELKTDSNSTSISLKDFSLEKVIGRGGFGKVWRGLHKRSSRIFAIKEMQKIRIVKKNSVSSVLNERTLLSMLKHPFIINMQYAFQDYLSLYLVMDLVPGGDLRFHLSKSRIFTEAQTKFIICCILMGLEYLHINCVIHRDIKPENLVFDNKGYLRITDFGIAHQLRSDNSNDSSGTPGYMSPEVMLRKNHGIETDYFALGVIAFECMVGRRPYVGRSRKEIRDQILVRQVQLKKSDVPLGWSLEAADFINKLLQRNPKERLGSNGPQEIKNHSWLSDVEWKKILEKKFESPCKFLFEDAVDPRIGQEWQEVDEGAVDLEFIQNYFVGYHFDSAAHFGGMESTFVKRRR
jgi:serine/threonine protein kinase